MRNSDRLAAIVSLAIAVLILTQLRGLSYTGYIFPRAVACLLGVFGVFLFVKSYVKPDPKKMFVVGPPGRLLTFVVTVIVWIALIPVVGFVVTSVVAMTFLTAVLDRRIRSVGGVLRSMFVVALIVVAFYLAFGAALSVPLPRGFLI